MPRPSPTVPHLDDICAQCGYRAGNHYGMHPDNECPDPTDIWLGRRPEGARVTSARFTSHLLTGQTRPCNMCGHLPGQHRGRDAACPTRRAYSRVHTYSPSGMWPGPEGIDIERILGSFTQPGVYVSGGRGGSRRPPMTPTSPRRSRWSGEPGVYGYEHDGHTLCITCTRDALNVSAYSDARPAGDVARDGFGIPVGTSTTTQLRHRIGRTPEWCTPDNVNGCIIECSRCYGTLAEHSPAYHGWCDCGDGCENGDCGNCATTPDVDEDERSTGCRCAHCTAPELPVMHNADITLREAPEVSDEQVAAYLATIGTPAELAEA